jgi:hypothetical protein
MGHTFELDVWTNCTKSPGETRIECAGRNKCVDPENIICLCSINFTSMFTTTKFTSVCVMKNLCFATTVKYFFVS